MEGPADGGRRKDAEGGLPPSPLDIPLAQVRNRGFNEPRSLCKAKNYPGLYKKHAKAWVGPPGPLTP